MEVTSSDFILTFPALSSDRDLLPGHLEPPELLLQAGHVLSPGERDQERAQLSVEVVGGARVVLPARAGGGWQRAFERETHF